MNALYDYMRQIGQSAYGWVVRSPDSFALQAASENLRKAIQEKGESVLQCTFKDATVYPPVTYSAIEYGIKIGDVLSVRTLIHLRTDLESGLCDLSEELYFYLNCLEENRTPDLEMLNLLLNRNSVNAREYGLSPLEHALKNMSHYKKIHWDVIKTLFEKGAKISDDAGTTPFMILRDSHHHKISPRGKMERSTEEEEVFLNHLVDYLKMEKQYFPDTDSGLSLEEFKFHTSNIIGTFMMSEDPFSSVIFGTIDNLSKRLKNAPDDLSQEEKDGIKKFAPIVHTTQRDLVRLKNEELRSVSLALIEYHNFFNLLVKEGNFKDCFPPRVLASLVSYVTENTQSGSEQILSILLKQWGLMEEKQAEEIDTDSDL